jgi:hypothetical protein
MKNLKISFFQLCRYPFLLLLLIASISNTAGCEFLNLRIHYILPDGYVGMFKIILDETHGIEVTAKDGRYTYVIPQEGILRVKSFAPFRDMREYTAAYQDGTKIIVWDSTVSDNTVALRGIGTHSTDQTPLTKTVLIGTKEQADRLRGERFDDTLPSIYNQRLKEKTAP